MGSTRKHIFLTSFTLFSRELGAVRYYPPLSPFSHLHSHFLPRMSFMYKIQKIWGKLLMKQIKGEGEGGKFKPNECKF